MELKVDFNEKDLQAESLKATILKGAVDHLIGALTPDMLRGFMEKTLQQAFESILSWQMANAAKPYVDEIAKEYMTTPEVQERTRVAVRGAIDAALGKLPESMANDIAALARDSFRRAIESKFGRL